MRCLVRKGTFVLIAFWVTFSTALPWVQWGAVAATTDEPSCHNHPPLANHASSEPSGPRAVLRAFLQQQQQQQRRAAAAAAPSIGTFKIQGWRWHTMSLIREAKRLATALQNNNKNNNLNNSWSNLQDATDYVVKFNLQGLLKIQDDLFFPWVRDEIQTRATQSAAVAQAFGTVMEELQAASRQCKRLGQELQASVQRRDRDEAHQTAAQLAATAQEMLDTEQSLLIPLVAHFIPAHVQTSFNNRVIASLGVWDSRLHLVGMYQAIRHDAHERQLFQQEIPYLPRIMLTRWKRNLYDPKVTAFQDDDDDDDSDD